MSAKVGPISLGVGAERAAVGQTSPYARDFFNRPIPGTGKSVQDILAGKEWELLPIFKKGNWELTKIKLEFVFLLGFKLEMDFGDDLEKLGEWLDNNTPPPCEL